MTNPITRGLICGYLNHIQFQYYSKDYSLNMFHDSDAITCYTVTTFRSYVIGKLVLALNSIFFKCDSHEWCN